MEIKNLSVDDIVTDLSYQRNLDGARVQKMAKNWNLDLLQPLDVSMRKTSEGVIPYVIDGQHRLAAARLKDETTIMCRIHRNLSRAEEAALFIALQQNRKELQSLDLFWALLSSGDATAETLKEAVERHGLKIGRKVGANANKTIIGTSALFSVYRKGPDVLDHTLRIIATAWNGSSRAMLRSVISGVGRFVEEFIRHENYDIATVIEKLSAYDVDAISNNGVALSRQLGLSASQGFALALLQAYNRRKSGRRLPDTMFKAA